MMMLPMHWKWNRAEILEHSYPELAARLRISLQADKSKEQLKQWEQKRQVGRKT
jgi:hypothetical protein